MGYLARCSLWALLLLAVPAVHAQTGSLRVLVRDAIPDWGSPGVGARVVLFTSGGSLIGEATTTTEASEVTFLRVPATSGYQYWVYVTQTKYPNIWGEAYWGRKTGITIMNGVTVVDTFRHNTPIMPGLAVYDNNDVELKAMSNRVLQPGVPIRFELTLENPANAGATVVNVYAKTYIDRNWSRAIDDTAQSSVYSLSVGSRTIWYFTRTTPSDPGIYAFAFGAFATGPGYSDRLTDGSNWHDSVFIIQAPPVLTSISPTVVDAGGPAISLTAYGSGFVPGSVVRFNSSDRITRYVSSTQLEAALTSADLAAVSDYTITVNNPAAGGGTSYAQPFRVQYPAPQLNQLSPPSRVAGSTGFTLSVDGTGFFSTSVVNWNGGSKSTSYTSGTRFFAGGDGPTSRSTDHGATWTSISNGLPSTWVYAFARTNSRVFAATYSGVFVTTDEGTNWSSAGLASMDVEALAVSGVYLLAGTYTSGVRYSTNAGSTWFQSDLASEAVRALMAVGNLVFAGTKNGVYVSTNNGVNWTQKSSGLLNTDVRAFTVIGGTVFAGTDGGGVYRSTNSGATWTWSYAAGINASAIALTAVGDYLFAGSYGVAGGVYRSTNGGTSWVATSTSVGNWIQSLAAYGGRLYAGTDAGVYVSTNFGVTWTKAGSPVTKILALDVSGGRLDATISSTDIASPGDYDVTVTNPVPVAGPSGKLTFRVDPASLAISTASPLPAGTTGVTYTTTVAASGGTLPYSWSLSSGALPTGLSLTPATGVISGIPIAGIAPASFQIRVTDNAGAHTEKDLSLSIYNPAPIISSLSPSSKTAGEAGFPLTVYGTGFINGSIVRVNASDRTTEFVSSTQLTATILTGDIASAGNLSVTVFTGIPGGGSSDPPATLTVNPVGLAITTSTPLPGGVVGTVYSTTLGASGGTPPYSWSLASGTWPSGLTMNSSGRVTGTPTAAVDGRLLTITVTDNASRSTSKDFTITIGNPRPVITSLSPSSKTAGEAGFPLTVYGTGFITGSIVRVNASDRTTKFESSTQLTATILTGDIASAGNLSVTVFTGLPGGGSSDSPATLTVNSVPVSITTATALPGGETGIAYSTILAATGGTPPYDWSLSSGDLPQGLTLSGSGAISGIPATAAAPASFRVRVTDYAGSYAEKDFSISVLNPFPVITSIVPSEKVVGEPAFSLTVNGSGFVPTSQVRYSGGVRTTSYVSATQVMASISADDVAVTGVQAITVSTPAPGGGTSTPPAVLTIALPVTPPRITVQSTWSFPSRTRADAFAQADYRLVGLPGDSTIPVTAILRGTPETDWRVAWDNGTSTNYLVRHSSTAPLSFGLGKSYWILSKANVTLDLNLPAVTVNNRNQAEIPLHPGWNMITNPFSGNVQWSTVVAANAGIENALWSFSGAWSTGTQMIPYMGYYFHNGQALGALRIPRPGALPKAAVNTDHSVFAWKVDVALKQADIVDSDLSFGVFRDTAQRPAPLHKPRGLAGIPETFFRRTDIDPAYPDFATDFRSPSSEVEAWEFRVTGVQGIASSLTFRGLAAVPPNVRVVLYDEQAETHRDLRDDSVYAITLHLPESGYRVLAGEQEATQKLLDLLAPQIFSLGPNFPNPFNPRTTIPLVIPTMTQAQVEVFSILGEHVATLHRGSIEPGRHWLEWDGLNSDGKPVSSGIYMVRVRTEDGKAAVLRVALVR